MYKPPYFMAKKKTLPKTLKQKTVSLFASEEEEYKYYLNEYRQKYLPEEYNQLELLDELLNPDIDHYMSITSRGDGKSFNYISALGYISSMIEQFTGICLIVRHFTLQDKMRELVEEILQTTAWCDFKNNYTYRANSDYIIITINEKDVFLITDLNNASDLKQSSAVLRNFGITLYDEFLTLTDDYVLNEYDKMRTIFKSIDRIKDRPYIKIPKCIYLGNPVNFDSPLLPALNIYNNLQTQEINTIKQYRNVLLELRRNDKRNEGKNTRAFPDPNDSDVTGEFNFSNYLLVNEQQYYQIFNGAKSVKIKLDEGKMLHLISKNDIMVLSIEQSDNEEQYCINLQDETDTCQILTAKYYKQNFIKKYEKGFFKYKDSFSKSFINRDTNLMMINLFKLIPQSKINTTDDTYKKVARDNFLKQLAKKYE